MNNLALLVNIYQKYGKRRGCCTRKLILISTEGYNQIDQVCNETV